MSETAFNSKKTALIAGGLGFVGEHLAEALLNQGINVVCLHNPSSSNNDSTSRLLNNPKFSFIPHDLGNPLPKFEESTKFDWIINLAGLEEVGGKNSGVATLLSGSIGTYGLLELAKTNSARFVLVSSCDTSSEFDSSTKQSSYFGTEIQTTDNPTQLEAIKFSESLTAQYGSKYSLDSVVLRIKDVFGPKMDLKAKNTLSRIVSQALHSKEIKLAGDGLEILNPTFVQDLVFGILKAIHSPEAKGRTFYLINPKTYTASSIASEIKKLLAKHVEIETTKTTHNLDLPHNKFNSQGAIEILGWAPRVSLSEGLQKTIEFFDQNELPRTVAKESQPSIDEVPQVVETRQRELDTRLEKLFSPKTAVLERKRDRRKFSLPTINMPTFQRSHVRSLIAVSSLALVVLSLVSPISNLVINKALAFGALEKSLEEFNNLSYQKASLRSGEALGHLKIVKSELNNLGWLVSLINQREAVDNVTDLVTFSENLSNGVRGASEGLLGIKGVLDQHLGGDKNLEEVNKAISEAGVSLGLADRELTLAKLGWGKVDKKSMGGLVGSSVLEKLEKGLGSYETVTFLNNNFGYLDSLLGLSKDKATAVLFRENTSRGTNQELFLALLKSKEAKLTAVFPKIEGLNIDVTQNSLEEIQNFGENLGHTLNQELSGVVVLDRTSLKKLAELLGVSYGEDQSLENGAKAVLTELLKIDFAKLVGVVNEFGKLTQEKHLIASINNTTDRGLISQKVLGVSAEAQEGDYLYFTNTSLTPPKNDPKVSFRYRLAVDEQGEMKSGLSLAFVPKPDSRYLGEVKVYYPKGSVLGSIFSSNGEKITAKKVELTSKTMYTFNVEVVDAPKTFDLEVRLPYKITTIKPTPYQLFIPKQPGQDKLQGELVIELPAQLRLMVNSAGHEQYTRPYRIPIESTTDYKFQGVFSNK